MLTNSDLFEDILEMVVTDYKCKGTNKKSQPHC